MTLEDDPFDEIMIRLVNRAREEVCALKGIIQALESVLAEEGVRENLLCYVMFSVMETRLTEYKREYRD